MFVVFDATIDLESVILMGSRDCLEEIFLIDFIALFCTSSDSSDSNINKNDNNCLSASTKCLGLVLNLVIRTISQNP